MARGKIIVIEGLDGSGKETQANALAIRLNSEGYKTVKISLPDYGKPHCTMVEQYLGGEYRDQYSRYDNPSTIFMRQVAMMYATDRIGAFITPRKEFDGETLIKMVKSGYTIICDRYTTSSMLNLSANLHDTKEKKDFIKWIQWEEYKNLGIPEPSAVFYLDVSIEKSLNNILIRGKNTDIHENIQHLTSVYNNRELLIHYCGWNRINCMSNETDMRTLNDINNELFEKVKIELDKVSYPYASIDNEKKDA